MVTLLQVLPEYVLYWLVNRGTERRVLQTEVLLRAGERQSSLYIVLDGVFSISVGPKHLHKAAGSIIGGETLFLDAPGVETYTADEPSLVLEISGRVLAEKLAHDHVFASDFYRALLTSMSHDLRNFSLHRLTDSQTNAGGNGHSAAIDAAMARLGEFKKMIVDLDKEIIKKGSLSDEKTRSFLDLSDILMKVSNDILGDTSPLDDASKSVIGARFQQELLPYVLTTSTADRFYSKPRGYAGDYLAIHNIYENVPQGAGRLGPLIDRMFLESPPARAVRNRRRLLTREILALLAARTNEKTNVLCIASGPATEIFDAFDALEDPARLKVTLMDIDLQALAFVDDRRGRQRLASNITLINENLIALFLGRGTAAIEPQQMIYSIGLIDYLNDKLIGKLLRFAYDHLTPGGKIILGNFHTSNPAHAFMDHVLEWNLIHRTEDDMHRLFTNSPFNRPSTRIQYEEEGINLFAECIRE